MIFVGGFNCRTVVTVWVILMIALGGCFLELRAQEILRGGIQKSIDYGSTTSLSKEAKSSPMINTREPFGVIRHGVTGKPIDNATVAIPDIGFQTKTGQDGRFFLPELERYPVILNVTKPGFVPESKTLQGRITQHSPLKIQIRQQNQVLILDEQLHHLGDNRYAPASAGAMDFQKRSEGATLVIPFQMEGVDLAYCPTLQIGTIIGLDTPQAHLLNQSGVTYASSPMIIRLNGMEIAQLKVNGDRQRIEVPLEILRKRGVNILEIETGYHTPGGTRIDFDDLEFMNVQLEMGSG